MSFLLDGIHEDLNRIKKKPFTETVESNGEPDQQVASKAFDVHKLRNDSVIIDLMCGQYKSQVQCPIETCGKLSITFDPFISISLPIPAKTTKKIKVYFVPKDTFDVLLLEIEFTKNSGHTIGDLAKDVLKKLGKEDKGEFEFKLISSYYKEDISLEDKTQEVKKKTNFKNLAMRELSDLEVSIPKEQRVEIFLNVSYTCTEYYKKGIGYLYFFFVPSDSLVQNIVEFVQKIFYPIYDMSYGDYIDFANSEKPPYKISLESNSRNWQACYFCKNKCDKCDITRFSQTQILELKNCIPEKENSFCLQINVVWNAKSESKIEMESLEKFFLCIKNKDEGDSYKNLMKDKPNYSLTDCLEKFREPEQLGEENSWYCSSCKEHREAVKKLEIYKSPEILVIHLKRFKEVKKMSGMSGLSKIDSFIDYPFELEMTDFVLSTSSQNSSSSGGNQELKYELYGVVNHMGSINFGHYTAFCKNKSSNKWHLYDDSSVSEVMNEEKVVNKSAYILFYRKKMN